MDSWFLKSPAAYLATALMVGITMGLRFPLPASLWGLLLVLAGLCLLGSLGLRPRRPAVRWLLLLLFAAFLGGARYQAASRQPKGLAWFSPGPARLRGTVASDPDSISQGVRFTLRPQAEPEVGVLVRLRKGAAKVCYGDGIELVGTMAVPPGQRNPGGFDYQAFLRRSGIHFLLDARGDSAVSVLAHGRGNPVVRRLVLPLRREVFRIFGASLRGEPEALLKGLILGERSDLPQETIEAFADTGTVHILAVSGFNVGLVILVFFLLFRGLGLSPTLANLLLLPLLLLYAGLTGFTPSVVRATIMALVFLIGFLLEREPLSLNSLGVAALIILLLWPQALDELSFQLSFAATFGIVFLAPRLYSLLSQAFHKTLVAKWVVLPLFVSLSATAFSAPLILRSFYRLSLISPLSNLVVLPLVTLSTGLGFAQALTGFLSLGLSRVFAAANWPVLKGILVLTKLFADLPFCSLRFGLPALTLGSAYGLLLSAPWLRRRWLARVVFAGSALLFLSPLAWRTAHRNPGDLTVTFLDVGEGDAACLEFPNGRAVLLDGGGGYEGWSAGEMNLAPFLWEQGRTRLDAVVASHLHQDHVGGLPFILDQLPVSRFVESEAPCSTAAGALLHSVVRRHRIPPYRMATGDTLWLDPAVTVQALLPSRGMVASVAADPKPDPNFTSLILKVTFREVSFLFSGDMPSDADSALLVSGYDPASAVLKIPHHGSSRASSPDFVEAVHPRLAVISLSAKNSEGFPHPSVVELYREAGARIVRTDEQGAITVRTDGHRLWVRTMVHPGWQELVKP